MLNTSCKVYVRERKGKSLLQKIQPYMLAYGIKPDQFEMVGQTVVKRSASKSRIYAHRTSMNTPIIKKPERINIYSQLTVPLQIYMDAFKNSIQKRPRPQSATVKRSPQRSQQLFTKQHSNAQQQQNKLLLVRDQDLAQQKINQETKLSRQSSRVRQEANKKQVTELAYEPDFEEVENPTQPLTIDIEPNLQAPTNTENQESANTNNRLEILEYKADIKGPDSFTPSEIKLNSSQMPWILVNDEFKMADTPSAFDKLLKQATQDIDAVSNNQKPNFKRSHTTVAPTQLKSDERSSLQSQQFHLTSQNQESNRIFTSQGTVVFQISDKGDKSDITPFGNRLEVDYQKADTFNYSMDEEPQSQGEKFITNINILGQIVSVFVQSQSILLRDYYDRELTIPITNVATIENEIIETLDKYYFYYCQATLLGILKLQVLKLQNIISRSILMKECDISYNDNVYKCSFYKRCMNNNYLVTQYEIQLKSNDEERMMRFHLDKDSKKLLLRNFSAICPLLVVYEFSFDFLKSVLKKLF